MATALFGFMNYLSSLLGYISLAQPLFAPDFYSTKKETRPIVSSQSWFNSATETLYFLDQPKAHLSVQKRYRRTQRRPEKGRAIFRGTR